MDPTSLAAFVPGHEEPARRAIEIVRRWYAERLPLVESGRLDANEAFLEIYPATLASLCVPRLAELVGDMRTRMYAAGVGEIATIARGRERPIFAAIEAAELDMATRHSDGGGSP